jgi:hypothetical protein
MSTYTVHAKRWERGWELHIDDFGVTQSKSLRDAPKMVADYIRLDTGTTPDASEIEIIPEIGGGLDEQARAARQAVANADRAQREAAARSRATARKLQSTGLTGRDIAAVLRLSPQRVSQLLGGHRKSQRANDALHRTHTHQ